MSRWWIEAAEILVSVRAWVSHFCYKAEEGWKETIQVARPLSSAWIKSVTEVNELWAAQRRAVRLAASSRGVMYESIVLRANRLLLCFFTTKSIRGDDVPWSSTYFPWNKKKTLVGKWRKRLKIPVISPAIKETKDNRSLWKLCSILFWC